jgi:hypothetical protein
VVNKLPFIENIISEEGIKIKTRLFSKNTDPLDLLWHWDEEDRLIYTEKETDWMFQMDNMLPQKIKGGIFIKKGDWHRLIKGSGDLVLVIERF